MMHDSQDTLPSPDQRGKKPLTPEQKSFLAEVTQFVVKRGIAKSYQDHMLKMAALFISDSSIEQIIQRTVDPEERIKEIKNAKGLSAASREAAYAELPFGFFKGGKDDNGWYTYGLVRIDPDTSMNFEHAFEYDENGNVVRDGEDDNYSGATIFSLDTEGKFHPREDFMNIDHEAFSQVLELFEKQEAIGLTFIEE